MYRVVEEGITVRVHLQPGASKDELLGAEEHPIEGPVLKARVRAIPEKGKANGALGKMLAKSLGLPKTAVEVISGPKSRIKTVLIRGESKQLINRFKRVL